MKTETGLDKGLEVWDLPHTLEGKTYNVFTELTDTDYSLRSREGHVGRKEGVE